LTGLINPIDCDTRIIAATNQDLAEKAGKGAFRKDLFFRLNVLSLIIPSLRERENDVILPADHHIRRFNGKIKVFPPVRTPGDRKNLTFFFAGA